MIAVDTNVLLRRVLNDDETQSTKARKLFEGATAVLVSDVVLAETVWTITGKRYRATREDIRALIFGLLEERNLVFENKQVVWSALNDFMAALPVKTANGAKAADFVDALVVHKARAVALGRGLEYEGTYTFDRPALQLAGTKTP